MQNDAVVWLNPEYKLNIDLHWREVPVVNNPGGWGGRVGPVAGLTVQPPRVVAQSESTKTGQSLINEWRLKRWQSKSYKAALIARDGRNINQNRFSGSFLTWKYFADHDKTYFFHVNTIFNVFSTFNDRLLKIIPNQKNTPTASHEKLNASFQGC